MYCKKCGSDKHYTLYCDKEEKDESRVGVSVARDGVALGDTGGEGTAAQDDRKWGERVTECRDDDGGVSVFPNRFVRWKKQNREKYNEYMREYMKRRRKLLTRDK